MKIEITIYVCEYYTKHNDNFKYVRHNVFTDYGKALKQINKLVSKEEEQVNLVYKYVGNNTHMFILNDSMFKIVEHRL